MLDILKNNYESEEVMFMGSFDKEANNPLDDMFDMNGDGYLSSSEEAMKYDFFNSFDSPSGNDYDSDFLADFD